MKKTVKITRQEEATSSVMAVAQKKRAKKMKFNIKWIFFRHCIELTQAIWEYFGYGIERI